MSKKILFLFFCVFALAAHSQNVVIKGSVTDVNKEPLLGVNIKVKGTSTGTITDIDGNFSINGPKGATLVISYIGMVTQEVEYKGQPLNVVLKDDSQALEEVVVVGYGTMKKSDISGASVSMGEDQIKGSIITNLDQSFQGRVAGVTSVATSGAPGSSTP